MLLRIPTSLFSNLGPGAARLDPTIGNSAGKTQSVFILLAGVLVRTRTFVSPYFLNRTKSETSMGENPKEY